MRSIPRLIVVGAVTSFAIVLSLLGLGGTPARAASHSIYAVTDLGTLDLGTPGGESFGFGVNNGGEVAGCSTLGVTSVCDRGFLFSGGNLTNLGTLPGGAYSVASALNDMGQVVGTSGLTGFNIGLPFGHAFLFSDGQMTDLGTLGGSWSQAFAINESGDVAGGAYVAGDVTQHAFLDQAGKMIDINPPGSSISVAFGVNASDAVVGLEYHRDARGFLFQNGQVTEFGSNSEAKAINASGEVVGLAGSHAFAYRNGQISDLGSLGGSAGVSEAQAINDAGQIVGWSTIAPSPSPIYAFFSNATAMVNLNDLIPADSGWYLESATGINNRGQITGYGFHGGQQRAFLLTPTGRS